LDHLSNSTELEVKIFERRANSDFVSASISTTNSMLLGKNFWTLSLNPDNTSTLAPSKLIHPIEFYDPRCRTLRLHNGA
ncbi:MAG: hypothetical protein AAF902_15790, partial [Chloroflexota bacterium]